MLGIESIGGLPAHPFIVHAAVVLVPLAALGLVGTGWRADWRQRYALPLAVIAIVGAGAAILAASTGESLQHDIRAAAQSSGVRARFGDHPEQGDTAEIFSVLLAVAAAGLWTVSRWRQRLALPAWSGGAVYGVVVIVSVLAVFSIAVAGHSGAGLVWDDLGTFVTAAN